ncbi:Endonuclease 4 (AtENDO4) (Deoxyribonuclease ENDO4) (Single-stranded-nucleate endonuclease ENDO4) [Durusdinium trenchii]|uniref:Endonuclease 4 (AtENDO4) (Deoxyribonuclease ENDO4) (Single-stranded-nucleate endonuclease ENDO4) n=1 Tax=Durusdinium trenchii TaxID=1381693 RepID=A0ABP0KCZ2_9DINO
MSFGSGLVGGGLWRTLALVLALCLRAHAWDKDGHEAIGMTTMSALDTSAVAQVKHLMGGKDAADVAAWAHKVNKKYPWTTELHFQRQPSTRCEKAQIDDCKDNRCLMKAILYFYGRLTGKDLGVEITWPDGVKLTDADCVKYLINLLGDMAQPLHFGTADTDMGRNITVLFRDKKTTLFDVWDKEITQSVIKNEPHFWWGGWTHVQRTRVEYERDSEQFKKEHESLLNRWADESAKFMCSSVYRNPITGKQITEELDENGVFRLNEQLYDIWKREMFSKMLVAGARVAIVLNSILHHREGQLHAGTAVSHLEGEEEEEESSSKVLKGRRADIPHRQHIRGFPAFLLNLFIGSIALFCFLVLMRLWAGPDRAKQAEREKRSATGTAGKKT